MDEMDIRSNGGITYQFYSGAPLWPFGFGLSYTSFKFTWARKPTTGETTAVEALEYAVDVENTGSRAGAVSLLAFLSRASSSPLVPKRELFDFQRTELQPRETARLTFTIDKDVLADSDENGVASIHPGSYTIRIGEPNQELEAALELKGLAVETYRLPTKEEQVFV